MAEVVPDGIAVLGSHPETKLLAPFDRNWLIYACSPDNSPYGQNTKQTLPRVDAWFELHKPIAHSSRPYGYLRWLEDMPVLYMRDKAAMPFFKGAVEYPEDQMKERFGPFAFTSSIAYILAKAIVDAEACGAKSIGLWGVMQASDTEYHKHRQGTQQMMFEARKAGLKVVVPEQAKALFDLPAEDW